MQIHQTVERVECKTCEKTFSSLHVLKAHIKNIHNRIKVECNQCQKVLHCEQSLKAHKLFFIPTLRKKHLNVKFVKRLLLGKISLKGITNMSTKKGKNLHVAFVEENLSAHLNYVSIQKEFTMKRFLNVMFVT